jgi:hypothetical protein
MTRYVSAIASRPLLRAILDRFKEIVHPANGRDGLTTMGARGSVSKLRA